MNILRHLSKNPKIQLSATSLTNKSNINAVPTHWLELDLRNTDALTNYLRDLDSVIYLPHVGGPNVIKNLQEERDQNLLPLENFFRVLRSLKKEKPLKVIYFSSGGAIYGKSLFQQPWKESDATAPVSQYGILKKMSETLFKNAVNEGLCEAICLRPSNPYGNHFKHQKAQGIIDVAINKIKEDKEFTLYGSKDFIRDFIHLDDLTSAVEKCLSYSTSFEIFNIGSGIGTTIGKTLELVQASLSKTLKIETISMPPEIITVDWCILDISKAKSLLQWEPKISLVEGIHLATH